MFLGKGSRCSPILCGTSPCSSSAWGYLRCTCSPPFLALLKALVLKVETVFQQSFLQELRDIIQGHMDQGQLPNDGRHDIEDDV